MTYLPHQIYHLYNQGNNRQQLFFSKYNYYLFLDKVRKYLVPNVDILSYCLMPNHFHFLIYMKEAGCFRSNQAIVGVQNDDPTLRYQQQMSKDLSILLRSYTRAINNQNNRSGALFRPKTKAKQDHNDFIINNLGRSCLIANDYEQTCFNYIHQNPVKAGLVQREIDWAYSSAREYTYKKAKGLCNKELSFKLGLNY